MVFFKRLSRSRSNSQSYVDSYDSRHDSKTGSALYDDKTAVAPATASPIDNDTTQGVAVSRQSQSNDIPSHHDPRSSSSNMYPRQSQPTEIAAHSQYQSGAGNASGRASNGYSGGGSAYDPMAPSAASKLEPAPDALLQAFNQAVRPYSDKIENLESEISDLRAYIDSLESQQKEVHAWIDKRGLRPDVPHTIARAMDTSAHATSPTAAASTLTAQLDRKITIVNFDLHRLQDDLNDSLPTPSFSACMLKFLPDIDRLRQLPSGPRSAFDLLLKLGGNLNSHGGLENGDEEDLAERRSFYARLDEAMVSVVRGRFEEEGDSWGVAREIKRIEKTGAYLRNWGVEPYFPRTLQEMREGTHAGSAGPAQGMAGGYN